MEVEQYKREHQCFPLLTRQEKGKQAFDVSFANSAGTLEYNSEYKESIIWWKAKLDLVAVLVWWKTNQVLQAHIESFQTPKYIFAILQSNTFIIQDVEHNLTR